MPEQSLMIEENMPHSLPINVERARFPCCIVWTPLPVLSWFVPFIGHIGVCREDGVILDFAGPNFVCVDNFAFGAPTRYCQIKKQQCNCFHHSTEYGSEDGCNSNEFGKDLSRWDDSLRRSTQEFQHRSYNIFTCNCHSFVANCLNRLEFRAGEWNVVNLAIFIFLNGHWVSKSAFVKTYLPFILVFGLGLTYGGWSFLSYLAIFIFLLVGWFVLGSYCFKKLIYL